MIFVDTNVIVDLFERDSRWREWSRAQLADAGALGRLVIDTIVVAECAPRFDSLADLRQRLAALDIEIEELPLEAAFAAGRIFQRYRRDGSERVKILADFLIGAHAHGLGATLLTRDKRIYQRYFPDLPLITPETDNG